MAKAGNSYNNVVISEPRYCNSLLCLMGPLTGGCHRRGASSQQVLDTALVVLLRAGHLLHGRWRGRSSICLVPAAEQIVKPSTCLQVFCFLLADERDASGSPNEFRPVKTLFGTPKNDQKHLRQRQNHYMRAHWPKGP